MTNTPGLASPGSSDSPEPEDGNGSTAPASPSEPDGAPSGQDVQDAQGSQDDEGPQDGQEPPRTGWAQKQPPPTSGWVGSAPLGSPRAHTPPQNAPYPQQPQYWSGQGGQGGPQGPRWGAPPPPGVWAQRGPWGRPPAPKPGVIPLRPLGVGEILDGAISTLRRHWRAIVGFTAVIAVVVEGAAVVVQGLFVDDSRLNDLRDNPNPSTHDILRALSGAYAGLSLTALVGMIGTLMATAILTTACSRAALGRPVRAADIWGDTRPRLLQLIGLTLLLVVAYVGVVALGAVPGVLVALSGARTGGAALAFLGVLGGMVAAIWLWIRWCLAPPALMLEKQGIVAAIKRSGKLIRGSWWRALGVQLLAIALIYIASSAVGLPFMLIASAVTGDSLGSFFGGDSTMGWPFLVITGIGSAVATMLTLPISAGVASFLYMDQRIRRESLDVELLRAAEPAKQG